MREVVRVFGSKKKLIVVLGMHRSGTSAIARGLMALGVDLGTNLMPAVENNNEKGFFEDVDVCELNDEILRLLGSHWSALSSIHIEMLGDELESLKSRATQILEEKMTGVIFGLKDPRVCRLLPFWTSVFDSMQLSVSYVIAVRHPMSVARSLKLRNDIDDKHSYYLWLRHVVPALLATAGEQRVVVDYDRLMSDPNMQLRRISERLGLAYIHDSASASYYSSEFLEERMRHTLYNRDDLARDGVVPCEVSCIYDLLLRLASDEVSVNDEEVADKIKMFGVRLEQLSYPLDYMNQLIDSINEQRALISNQSAMLSQILRSQDELREYSLSLNADILECRATIRDIHTSRTWRVIQALDRAKKLVLFRRL